MRRICVEAASGHFRLQLFYASLHILLASFGDILVYGEPEELTVQMEKSRTDKDE